MIAEAVPSRLPRTMPRKYQWQQSYGAPLRPSSRYPSGRCKVCGVALTGRKTAYCSHDCSYAFGEAWFSGKVHWLRMHVFIRDRFACQDCGLLPRREWWVRATRDERPFRKPVGYYFVGFLPDCTQLEMHHIIPVASGGTDDPVNLVTLCADCHKARHSGARARIAHAREQVANKQPTLMD